MSSTTLISVEEFLATSYKPACEYLDGVLRQKSMPTYKHGKLELRLCNLINALENGFDATPEQTVRLREGRYLVPDVAVQRLDELQQPYPTKPIALCIEVLSPDDRFSEALAKCEEYHAWGVPVCWLVDPERRECWVYESAGRPQLIAIGGTLLAGEIAISTDDLFAGI